MSIPISLLRSATGTNQVKRLDMTWDELANWLTEDAIHDGPKIQLPGWIPAEFHGTTRGNEYVRWVTCAVLDLDDAKAEDIAILHERLRTAQWNYIWHTSHSHMRVCGDREHKDGCPSHCHAPKLPKYRFVLQLSRPATAAEWPRVWAGLAEIAPRLDKACKDPTRLYFVPGHPTGSPHDAGRFDGGRSLDVDAVLAHTAAVEPVLKLVGEAPTLKAWRQLAEKNANGLSAARALGGTAMLALADGQEFAPTGQRDTALFQMAAIIAGRYPHTEPKLLIECIRPELEKQTANEKWSEGDGALELEAKIARCQAEKLAELGGDVAQRLGQLGREDPYLAHEIEQYVYQLGLRDAAQLALQLVVHCQGQTWVFYEGQYIFAGSKDNAEPLVRQRLQAATSLPGVTLSEIGPKGIQERTMASILRTYGTPVEQIIHSLTEPHTRLDLIARPTKFIVASAPRDRRRKPTHSPRVETFLRRLAGEDVTYERLMDWLATAPKLERATAALYLHGAKRTGKSQLARGLAAIWGVRPTLIGEASGSFNEHLARSPLVVADETMPIEYRQDSGRLRHLITETAHSLRRKYQDNGSLEGALRVVLAANNLSMLSNPWEVLEQYDVEAICERVFYVDAGTREAEYIHEVEIAEHVLWLEENRKVAGDGRLWVSGVDSPLHRALRTRGKHRAAVCQWLLKFVEAPQLVARASAGKRFQLGEDGLWISPRLIHSAWDTYMSGERQLELPQVTSAVFEICTDRGLKPGLVRIRLEDLYQFAESVTWGLTGLAELEAMVRAGGSAK